MLERVDVSKKNRSMIKSLSVCINNISTPCSQPGLQEAHPLLRTIMALRTAKEDVSADEYNSLCGCSGDRSHCERNDPLNCNSNMVHEY